jgi:SAM-dependent MidA family methyltransferase
MTFKEFMEHALFHPEHGYYTQGRAPGRGGDYFTSVSVGRCFADLLAGYFHQRWEEQGNPAPFTLLEQGGHTGTLAADLLQVINAKFPAFYASLQWVAVERSRHAMSDARLQKHRHWRVVDNLEAVDRASVHLAFSNELLDAFPVHRVRWMGAEAGWMELYVVAADQGLGWEEGPLSEIALEEALASVDTAALPVGYTTEVNLALGPWCAATRALLQPAGRVLIIDYGLSEEAYYSPGRTEGTLQGYADHRRVHDLLAHPGTHDLTAHVNFTRLGVCAKAAGFEVLQCEDQQRFLTRLAKEPLLKMEQSLRGGAPDADMAQWIRQFRQLISMGSNFKVMELALR